MQVTIGKAKVNLSDEKIMSPGNLPNGSFFNAGYNRPTNTITDPNKIKNFCISFLL
jgi:hypothetical protein|tara:strand:- start:2124 stop:2291 length:168 start_codon:yes stop_codon:yes gene_type:complete